MRFLLLVIFFSSATSNNTESTLKSFLTENRKFRTDLYKQVLAAEEGNVIFSPLSVTFLLSFIHYGAKSSTLDEFQNVLHIPNNLSEFESAVHHLRKSVKRNEHFILHIFNKAYVKEGFPINIEFRNTVKSLMRAGVENIDFLKPGAADSINEWGQHTENHVANMIEQSQLDSHTRLLLLGGAYLKANWLQQFPELDTHQSDFYVSQSKSSKVVSMELVSYWNYLESSELDSKVVELEFTGGVGSLTIILPNQKDGLKNLEAVSGRYASIGNFNRTKLRLVLPKFQIKSLIKLKPALKNLGIVAAFSDNQADLSGISGNPGDLFVDDVVQKDFIVVDEIGVSGLEEAKSSYAALASFEPDPIEDFIVDHPFLFYIKVRGIPFFSGRVVDPSQVE